MDRKSTTNQRWFKRLRFAEIVAAAAIPFLSALQTNSFPDQDCDRCLGVRCVIASLLGLLQLQVHWIEYRAIAEFAQKREIFVSDPDGTLR